MTCEFTMHTAHWCVTGPCAEHVWTVSLNELLRTYSPEEVTGAATRWIGT